MKNVPDNTRIIDVMAENISEVGIYCIKDKKSPGYKAKVDWLKANLKNGLRLKIAADENGKQLGFIEYIPSEFAWRPVNAKNYLFIHCIGVFAKDARNKNIGSALLNRCEQDAISLKKSGVCVMGSEGAWMANRALFEKNGYRIADKHDRFELLVKRFDEKNPMPQFVDWETQLAKYSDWNLVYSDQCPWHEKSVTDLKRCASEKGIDLKVTKITTPKEAQKAPSGFGTFSLIKDGKLLADHYISRTRFENILKQEV